MTFGRLFVGSLLLAGTVAASPVLAHQHHRHAKAPHAFRPSNAGARAISQPASADDTAKFLAGLPVSSGSPLAPLADSPQGKAHAAFFDKTFKALDDEQLSKVRDWSKANVTSHESTLFYFFSGPDFLYANAFFPDAKTYILAGLETPGSIPDMTKVSLGGISVDLRSLEISTRTILEASFFVTRDMMSDLHRSQVSGTLPVIYMFMARSGKVLKDVSLVQLNDNGDVEPMDGPVKHFPTGAKIVFSSPGGPDQTLYYFGANLANGSFKQNGFEKFCLKYGKGDALVKSASYVMHDSTFSDVRQFLLDHSTSIVQDDTGVPVALFNSSWALHPFGVYLKPIPVFSYRYQPKMAQLFSKEKPGPLNFRIGYRYRPNQSALLLAVKQGEEKPVEAKTPEAKTPEAKAPEPTAPETKASDAKAPEAKMPETKPEAKSPDAPAPAMKADKVPAPASPAPKPDDAAPAMPSSGTTGSTPKP